MPNDSDDLTKGGTLSYLVGTSVDPSGWKPVVDPATAIAEASAGGADPVRSPGGLRRGHTAACTSPSPRRSPTPVPRHGAAGQVVNRGGVYSVSAMGVPDLADAERRARPYTRLTPMIEVNDPKYVSQEQAKDQQGLQFPDNIAFDGKGNLWVHEDVPDGAARSRPAASTSPSRSATSRTSSTCSC